MSHLTKVMLRVLMRNKIIPETSETQFGFRTDKGTRNAIFSLRTRMERAIEVQKGLYLCFIDYSKAFDKVKHSDLFDILLRHNCDGKDLRAMRNLCWEQKATMRIDDDYSVYKPICRGMRQGCFLNSDLFNIYNEIIIRKITHHEGVRVGGNNINNLRYTDDTVQNVLTTVTIESENKGLQVNAKKTGCMVISK